MTGPLEGQPATTLAMVPADDCFLNRGPWSPQQPTHRPARLWLACQRRGLVPATFISITTALTSPTGYRPRLSALIPAGITATA
jgi:hypothetical protein